MQEATFSQVPVVHEFGHLLGLDHPVCKGNDDRCYGVTFEQKNDLMGQTAARSRRARFIRSSGSCNVMARSAARRSAIRGTPFRPQTEPHDARSNQLQRTRRSMKTRLDHTPKSRSACGPPSRGRTRAGAAAFCARDRAGSHRLAGPAGVDWLTNVCRKNASSTTSPRCESRPHPTAACLAAAMHAYAYAVGNHIAFAEGRFSSGYPCLGSGFFLGTSRRIPFNRQRPVRILSV